MTYAKEKAFEFTDTEGGVSSFAVEALIAAVIEKCAVVAGRTPGSAEQMSNIRALAASPALQPAPPPLGFTLEEPGPGCMAAAPQLSVPAEPRHLGSQRVDLDDRHDEGKVNAAWTAMRAPLAKDAMKALRMVAEAHCIEACDDDECYFPRCIGDGCEGEPAEPVDPPAAPPAGTAKP